MRRQNLMYYKNSTLLKNALSFFLSVSTTDVTIVRKSCNHLPCYRERQDFSAYYLFYHVGHCSAVYNFMTLKVNKRRRKLHFRNHCKRESKNTLMNALPKQYLETLEIFFLFDQRKNWEHHSFGPTYYCLLAI